MSESTDATDYPELSPLAPCSVCPQRLHSVCVLLSLNPVLYLINVYHLYTQSFGQLFSTVNDLRQALLMFSVK